MPNIWHNQEQAFINRTKAAMNWAYLVKLPLMTTHLADALTITDMALIFMDLIRQTHPAHLVP